MNLEETIVNQNNKIQLLQSELNTYQKRCAQYADAYDQMKHQLQEWLRHRFVKKSERFIDNENHPQKNFFETWHDPIEQKNTEETTTVTTHQRHRKNKSNKELPRRVEIIPVSECDKQCICGC